MVALFIESYICAVEAQSLTPKIILAKFNIIRLIIVLICGFIFAYLYKTKNLTLYLHKYRYLIGFILLIILIALQISGISLECWNNYNSDKNIWNGLIAGVSRPIRSDEWRVFTTLSFSQEFNNYGFYSNLSRATETNMFMVYGQPVADISMIFRPFQ